jgi:hypothetical protein
MYRPRPPPPAADAVRKNVKERGAKKRLEKKKADGKRRLGGRGRSRLTGSTGVDLAEHELLHLVVEREDSGSGDTSEDVGTSSLEEL